MSAVRFQVALTKALLLAAIPALVWAGTPAPASSAGSAPAPLATLPGASSVAVEDDASALFLNPAALGHSVPWGYYLSWDRSEFGEPDLGTAGLSLGPLGFGYQQERPQKLDRTDRILLSQGSRVDRAFSVGTRESWERHGRIGPDAKIWRWDAGLLWRPARYVSCGVLAQDLNQARLSGQVLHRGYTIGLGLRPLPVDQGSRLTLFTDLSGQENRVWKDDAVLRGGLVVEPIKGIELSGSVGGPLGSFSDDRSFRFGVGLHMLDASSMLGLRYDRNDQLSRTVYASQGGSARQRTLDRRPVLAKIKLAGLYGDEGQQGMAIPIPFLGSPTLSSIRPVLRQLERAEKDPNVKGVLLEVSPLGMGALVGEVRDGIARVRAKGKPVVAWMEEAASLPQYYIASACDRIVLDSVSDLSGLGFRTDMLYFGAMLDSAGVQFEKVYHGKYKSAGEELVLSQASEGLKEQVNSILDDRQEKVFSDLAADRKMPREKLEELCNGQIIESPRALSEGLVDSLGDLRAAERILGRLADPKKAKKAAEGKDEGSSPTTSIAGWSYREYAWAPGPKVVVLWVDGDIEKGRSQRGFLSGNIMGSETVVEQLRAIGKRKDVKAVVLRIDSGGGDGVASDQMWRAVEEVQGKGKKVVASMARVAGSGGYYIACGADEIFADPLTITGSIGVLGIKPNLAGFYAKHHIGVETFQRGRMMGMYSSAAPLTEEERANMEQIIDKFYDHFLNRVAAGRPLSKEQIDEVGQGRIWTGRQAMERKLIDQVGGLHEAVARARELAGLPADARVENVYRPAGSFFERLLFGHQAARAAEWTALECILPGLMSLPEAGSPWDLWALRRSMNGNGSSRSGVVPRAENPILEPVGQDF